MFSVRNYITHLESAFWKKIRNNISPSILQFDYLHVRSLAGGITKALRKLPKNKKYQILDVGCGDKPYQSLFSPIAKRYVGVDIDRRVADVVGAAEKLPFGNNTFDLVVSFQTLEHCQYPLKVIAEIKRVLKSKGYCILTTHGIWIHHPCPHDYGRWTGEGLHELFSGFSEIDVKSTLTSWSALLQLLNVELYGLACKHIFFKFPIYIIIVMNSILGRILLPFGEKHLSINYVVLAKK